MDPEDHKISPLLPILSQMKPIQVITFSFFNIHSTTY